MRTLPDFLAADIEILSLGINPSPRAVVAGFPFATPQNRFWRALNASQLLANHYPPSVAAMQALLGTEKIGSSDVVKRPTASANDLRAADYRRWAPVTAEKIARYTPLIVWFHGKVAYDNFMRYGGWRDHHDPGWGARAGFGGVVPFVSPNPSGANAAFSLADIVRSYDALAKLRRRLRERRRSVE